MIGYFEPHGRKDTIAKTQGLEMVPRKLVEYRGSTFEEMDTDAIVARRPDIAIIDEFPHTNIPGSAREKRWEDVRYVLDNGIDVLTTMNVQHLESLNDQVAQITGVKVRETIPDWVVKQADEVVMVDLTPRALLHRLERGVIYAPRRRSGHLRISSKSRRWSPFAKWRYGRRPMKSKSVSSKRMEHNLQPTRPPYVAGGQMTRL